jgi:hypothetical protein
MEITEEDDEAEAMQTTAPQGSDRSITKWGGYDYESLLRRTSIMKSAEKEAATTMAIDEPTQASARSTNTNTGWRCYHFNNHHSQDAAQTTAAREKAQKQHPENEHVKRVGEQWHAQFRRIAREKGATDEKLDQLEKTHLQKGSQEQLMRALKALMVGPDDECVDVASELTEQQGISAPRCSLQWQNMQRQIHANSIQ